MMLYISSEEKILLEEIIEKLQLNLSKNNIDSKKKLENYIINTFFNPTKRERSIFNESLFLPDIDFFNDQDLLKKLEYNGLILIAGKKVLPTPFAIRIIQAESEFDLRELVMQYQMILGKKFIKVNSVSQIDLTMSDIAAFVFLLYNNNTSLERSDIGNEELAPVIDKITDSFVRGKVSSGTRSLNGRPGGGYFVRANQKLGYPIVMEHPNYYINSSKIKEIKEKIIDGINKLELDPTIHLKAFENCFDIHIKTLIRKGALFATKESKNKVRKIILGGNGDNGNQ
jgi:hypothetical protein